MTTIGSFVGRARALGLGLREETTAFVSWWLHELRDCADAFLARVAPGFARPIVVELDGEAAVVIAGTDRMPLVRPDNPPERRVRAVLALKERDALVHELTLPAVIERDLESVVDLQLERELPMKREHVCVYSQILRRDRAHQRITIRVVAVHRQRIEDIQRRSAEYGLRPVRIGVALRSGEICGDLLPRRARPDRLRVTPLDRRLAIAAGAVIALCGAVIAGQWIYERVQVNQELARVQALAAEADRTARELRRQSASGTALIALMRKADALDVLSTLTTSVPTDSWAYEVEVAPGQGGVLQVKLDGFAPTAATLVNVLEKAPDIERVRLVSSASAGIGTGKDRLKLTAKWAGK